MMLLKKSGQVLGVNIFFYFLNFSYLYTFFFVINFLFNCQVEVFLGLLELLTLLGRGFIEEGGKKRRRIIGS